LRGFKHRKIFSDSTSLDKKHDLIDYQSSHQL
jgi:hypothetical protein